MNLLNFLLDLIYPPQPVCLYCGQRLSFPEIKGLCSDCLAGIEFISNYCDVCGKKLILEDKEVCKNCQQQTYYFDRARSVAIYDGIFRELIMEFKYEGRKELSKVLVELLYLYFKEYYNNLSIDVIIPVPLHPKRRQIRGYNQAQLLAAGIHEKIKVLLRTDCVLRVKNNPPLYTLNSVQRQQILEDGFTINNDINIEGKNVLLIDDILTTGSTVNQVSSILKKQGRVNQVYVLTLATGQVLK